MKIASIKWESGSLNSAAIKKFKEMEINYHYSHFGELLADPYGVGLWLPVRYRKISRDVREIYVEV